MSTVKEGVIKSVASVTGKDENYVSRVYDVIFGDDEGEVLKGLLFNLGISYGMSAEMFLIVSKSTDPLDLLINFGIDHPYLEIAIIFIYKRWPEVRLDIRKNDIPNIYIHERNYMIRGKKAKYKRFLGKYLKPVENRSLCESIFTY